MIYIHLHEIGIDLNRLGNDLSLAGGIDGDKAEVFHRYDAQRVPFDGHIRDLASKAQIAKIAGRLEAISRTLNRISDPQGVRVSRDGLLDMLCRIGREGGKLPVSIAEIVVSHSIILRQIDFCSYP